MLDFISNTFRTKTLKHSAISFSGVIITGIFGAFFYILIARFLGPVDFGIFSVSVLVITLLSDVLSVGIDTGTIRFIGKYSTRDTQTALRFLKLGLLIKLGICLFLIVIGWFLIPQFAIYFFKKVEFVFPFRMALFGASGLMLFSFISSAINAYQKFIASNLLNVGANFLRLLIVVVFFSLGILTLNNTLYIYSFVLFFGFTIGIFLLPNFLNVGGEKKVIKEFFNYNKWIAIFTAIAALSSRLDSFITARFLPLEEVGIYSVAVTLSNIVPQIVFALGVVVAPKLASFDSNEKALSYLKKLQLFVVGLAFLGLLAGIPASYFLIPLMYGQSYIQSILPFVILLIAQAIFLISVPVHTAIIYYFSYPKLFVYVGTLHVLIVGFVGWFLISNFGYIGASVTVLIGILSNFLIPVIWFLKRIKK